MSCGVSAIGEAGNNYDRVTSESLDEVLAHRNAIGRERAASNDRKPLVLKTGQRAAQIQFLRRVRNLLQEGREFSRRKRYELVVHSDILS